MLRPSGPAPPPAGQGAHDRPTAKPHAAIIRICQQDAVRLPAPPTTAALRLRAVKAQQSRHGLLTDFLALAARRALSVAFVAARHGGLSRSSKLAVVGMVVSFLQVRWSARPALARRVAWVGVCRHWHAADASR
jgi:hypothetical protein